MLSETKNIYTRYAKRLDKSPLYRFLNPSVYMGMQERERALIRWVKYAALEPLEEKKVLEVGCGSGINLLQLLKFGFRPKNIVGIELQNDRAASARKILPSSVRIICADASEFDMNNEMFDVVIQMTVFSSLLDKDFQRKMADRMWQYVKPGGGILWYDFIYNNPKNPDVIGVPVKRIEELFPAGEVKVWPVTLAPPIGRLVTKIHPSLYALFNFLPFLRTHVLCWIRK